MKIADLWIGKRLLVGLGRPETLGRGTKEIRGSGYVEGPLQVGKSDEFNTVNRGNPSATVMIGPEYNTDTCNATGRTHPTQSLHVKGDVRIDPNSEGQTGDLFVADDISVGDDVRITDHLTVNGSTSGPKDSIKVPNCTAGNEAIQNKFGVKKQYWKGFDIEHPAKKGHRIRHICVEGPEGAVYVRGRVKNTTEIVLPSYWKDLVYTESITIQLQPIGAHQDVIVKRWDDEKVYLQGNAGMPINCFYLIFGERKDGERLIVEYPGESPADYPGDSNQYSIVGYDYDRRDK
jgi:hypothetical protein